MSTSESPPTRLRSSRRNLIRMGAVVASAIIAKTTPVSADRFRREDHDWDDRRDRDDRDRSHRDRNGREEHCFLRGTLIRTVRGDKKVEDLRVGDLVPTVFGGSVPIISIPPQRFGMAIRVARSALGPDVPNEDLYVSSPHALLIDGTLVGAGNLLNGTTINEALDFDHFDSFNIVLERHNVIYANGTPCETLLGPGEQSCVPRVPYGWRRGLIKSHFRSAVAPWIDRRQPVDIIRDGLEARGATFARQPELVP
jgi:Hint domain